MDDRIMIGFVIPGDGNWSGGVNYLRNLLVAISEHLSDRLSARLFVPPELAQLAERTFNLVLDVPAIVDPRVAGAGAGKRALEALVRGRDRAMCDLLTAHHVDVMFENAKFYGARNSFQVLSWIPDFQHQHLRHLFGRAAWWKRDIGFRMQCRTRPALLVSSLAAAADCERFYPASRGKVHAARFCANVPFVAVEERAATVRAAHGLPERFFFLPNQFWLHKNHEIVVEALAKIARSGEVGQMPPVIMTGSTADPRAPDHFARVMHMAATAGMADSFCHLGMIDYLDVLALNATALAVLNPSRFEGWASSAEEAKTMGSPLVLSDIPVHREQAPDAQFFKPDDADALGAILVALARAPDPVRAPQSVLRQADALRRARFAEEFMTAVTATGVRA